MSGTLDSARAAAEMVPEAHITYWDTKWLSCPEGWQVEMAVRAFQAGWPVEKVMERLEVLRAKSMAMFTLDTLKYLIHGGRISHIKGLLASLLHIRPVITVDPNTGKYAQLAQERTMKRAVQKMVELLGEIHAPGSELRMQVMHGKNPEMVDLLHETLDKAFHCHWLPTISVAPVLGAHTGAGVVAFAAAPVELFEI